MKILITQDTSFHFSLKWFALKKFERKVKARAVIEVTENRAAKTPGQKKTNKQKLARVKIL